jgi:hypothetical protein
MLERGPSFNSWALPPSLLTYSPPQPIISKLGVWTPHSLHPYLTSLTPGLKLTSLSHVASPFVKGVGPFSSTYSLSPPLTYLLGVCHPHPTTLLPQAHVFFPHSRPSFPNSRFLLLKSGMKAWFSSFNPYVGLLLPTSLNLSLLYLIHFILFPFPLNLKAFDLIGCFSL